MPQDYRPVGRCEDPGKNYRCPAPTQSGHIRIPLSLLASPTSELRAPSSNCSFVSMPIWASRWDLWGSCFSTFPVHSIPSGQAFWVISWQWCRWMPLSYYPGLLITWQEDHKMCIFSIVSDTRTSQGTILSSFMFTFYTTDFSCCTETCPLQRFSDDSVVLRCITKGDEMAYSSSSGGSRIICSLMWQR